MFRPSIRNAIGDCELQLSCRVDSRLGDVENMVFPAMARNVADAIIQRYRPSLQVADWGVGEREYFHRLFVFNSAELNRLIEAVATQARLEQLATPQLYLSKED